MLYIILYLQAFETEEAKETPFVYEPRLGKCSMIDHDCHHLLDNSYSLKERSDSSGTQDKFNPNTLYRSACTMTGNCEFQNPVDKL